MSNIQKAFKNKAKRGLCMAQGGVLRAGNAFSASGSGGDAAMEADMARGNDTSFTNSMKSQLQEPMRPNQTAAPAGGSGSLLPPPDAETAQIPNAMRDMASLGGESPLAGEGHGAQHNWITQSASDLSAGNPRYRAGGVGDPHASGFGMQAQQPVRPTGYAGYTAPSAIPSLAPPPQMAGEARRGLRMADGGVTPETPEQLLARMAAKYGGAAAPAPVARPAPAPAPALAPAPAPVQPRSIAGVYGALKGRASQLEAATNFANGTGGIDPRGMVQDPNGSYDVDTVDAKLAKGEAVLPHKTVLAMGGPEAVEQLIESTNGKPTATRSLREGMQVHAMYGLTTEEPQAAKAQPRAALLQSSTPNRMPDTQKIMRSITDRRALNDMQMQSDLARVRQPVAPSGEDILNGFNKATAPQQTVTQTRTATPVMAAEEQALRSGSSVADINRARGISAAKPTPAPAAPAAPAGPSPLAPEMTIPNDPAAAPVGGQPVKQGGLKGLVGRVWNGKTPPTPDAPAATASATPATPFKSSADMKAKLNANMSKSTGLLKGVETGIEEASRLGNKTVNALTGPVGKTLGLAGTVLSAGEAVHGSHFGKDAIDFNLAQNPSTTGVRGFGQGTARLADAGAQFVDNAASPVTWAMNKGAELIGSDKRWSANAASDALRRGLRDNIDGITAKTSAETERADTRTPVTSAGAGTGAGAGRGKQGGASMPEEEAIDYAGELQSRSIRSGQLMDTAQQGMRFPGGKDAMNAVKRGNAGLRSLASNADVRGEFNASHQEMGDGIAAHVTTGADGRKQTMFTGGRPTKDQYVGADGKTTNDWYKTDQYADGQRVAEQNRKALRTIRGYNNEALAMSNNPLDRQKAEAVTRQTALEDANEIAKSEQGIKGTLAEGQLQHYKALEQQYGRQAAAQMWQIKQGMADQSEKNLDALAENAFPSADGKTPNPEKQKFGLALHQAMATHGLYRPGQLNAAQQQNLLALFKGIRNEEEANRAVSARVAEFLRGNELQEGDYSEANAGGQIKRGPLGEYRDTPTRGKQYVRTTTGGGILAPSDATQKTFVYNNQ